MTSKASWILRDDQGLYKGALRGVRKHVKSALESEFQAIVMEMQHKWSQGYKNIIIKDDCKYAMDIINNQVLHFDSYNWKIEVIQWRKILKMSDSSGSTEKGIKLQTHWQNKEFQMIIFSCFIIIYVPMMITQDLHKEYVCSVQI